MAKKVHYIGRGNISNEKAARYGPRLQALQRELGEVTTTAVVDDARDPDSPLHDHFEWDDTEAGRKYREEQAGYMLRHVLIIPVRADIDTSDEGRGFVAVNGEDTGLYAGKRRFVSLDDARGNLTWRQQQIDSLKARLCQWLHACIPYSELDGIRAKVGAVIERESWQAVADATPDLDARADEARKRGGEARRGRGQNKPPSAKKRKSPHGDGGKKRSRKG